MLTWRFARLTNYIDTFLMEIHSLGVPMFVYSDTVRSRPLAVKLFADF